MSEIERSGFFWTLPEDRAGRLRLRDAFRAAGGTRSYIKAGGDGGVVWIPGVVLPDFARPQWGPWADDFDDPIPWYYNWPRDADKDAIVRTLQVRWSDTIVLNPETEWRWQNSNANPWHSLAEANAAAEAWVNDLRARIRAAFGKEVRIGFSSCPTWADFPYEGFVRSCDYALPQHYWFSRMFTAGENQVAASVRREHIARAGQAFPTVAVLTACGEYDEGGVVRLAQEALADDSETAGFSCWEAANGAFQANAIAQAFALLPTVDLHAEARPWDALTTTGPYFAQTDKWVIEPLLTYWRANGGLTEFGYPVSGLYVETAEGATKGLLVQWFERARLEVQADGSVTRGRVGAELSTLLKVA